MRRSRSTRIFAAFWRLMDRRPDPTDLADDQREVIEPLLPKARPGGRPPARTPTASFYIVCGGVPWRRLPHDLPPWGTVHYSYHWRIGKAPATSHRGLPTSELPNTILTGGAIPIS